jgi:catechol 2,3-dioxygenase-like lactoylglutathione lyase family enzyme
MTNDTTTRDTMTTPPTTGSLSLVNCFLMVEDPQRALDFYGGVLGCQVRNDVSHGDYRWITLTTPNQPELELVLTQVGSSPMSDTDRAAMSDLLAKGHLSALIFRVDDVDAMFEHVAASGAEVLQEPADQFYGVRDCAFRDPSGNLVRINSPLQQG